MKICRIWIVLFCLIFLGNTFFPTENIAAQERRNAKTNVHTVKIHFCDGGSVKTKYIKGATVIAIEEIKITNNKGLVSFFNVPTGKMKFTFEKEGFGSFSDSIDVKKNKKTIIKYYAVGRYNGD